MTESKLRKRIIDIKLGGARNKNRRKQAILLTDSKGKYLEEELSTESYLQLQVVHKSSISTDNPETRPFIWSTLRNLLNINDRAIICLWIGTCDFTFKFTKTGYIHLKYNTNTYRPRVDTIVERLQNLKRQIETRYRRWRVILLECPPFSIIQYNKTLGHLNSNTFHKQTVKLEDQITYFNEQIQAIDLTAASNITGRYIYKSSYMSPNFTKDI
jgi:hypothetical protein